MFPIKLNSLIMACEHQRKIINQSRAFLFGIDKPFLSVPCGKCAGCVMDKKNQWWIRIRQQIIDCLNAGGRVFFPTFTYSERTLPRYYYRNDEGKLCSFPCFNHQDKNLYIQRLREIFYRDGITEGFKYFWVSEYGDTQTHRSHYHVLFFFDSTYNKFTDKELEDIIRENWYFGRVDGNDELGMKVNPIYKDKAASYVSKYCTKDYDFFDQPDITNFIKCKGKGALDKIKDILPKTFTSKGMGEGLVDVVRESKNPLVYFNNGISLFMSNGSTKSFNLPRYITDKLMYQTDKVSGFRTLTEFGKQIKSQLFDNQLQESTNSLMMHSLEINLSKDVTQEQLDNFIPFGYSKDSHTLSQYIFHLMNGRTFEQLALYKKVFQGYTLTDWSDAEYISEVFNNSQRFKNYSKRVYINRLDVTLDDRLGNMTEDGDSTLHGSDYNNHMLETSLMNNLPEFKDFDKVLSIFEEITKISSSVRIKNALEKERKNRAIKAQLKEQKAQIRTLSRTSIISKFYKN